jgi:hypothetical protein
MLTVSNLRDHFLWMNYFKLDLYMNSILFMIFYIQTNDYENILLLS